MGIEIKGISDSGEEIVTPVEAAPTDTPVEAAPTDTPVEETVSPDASADAKEKESK